jgi:two-component system sensor histidine kinase UhpB
MSLRLRLNLLVAGMNLFFLLALAWVLLDNQREAIEEEIEAVHRVTAQMLGTTAQTSQFFGPVPTVMAGFVESLGRVRANEIRLYDASGQIRYTSPASTYKAGRRAPDWFETLMRPKLDATVLSLPGTRIEILPDASRAILDAWDAMTRIMLLGLIFIAALHVALLHLLRHLLQPTEADARRLIATTQALDENREVTRLIQGGIEAERKRLARELHDELGQSVTAIRLIATTVARSGSRMSPTQGVAKIDEIAASLYDGMHRIVRELRPAVLEQPDLPAALQDLAREWRTRHPEVQIELQLHGDLGDLGEAVTLAIFRAVQESLTNVLKHAAAEHVWVQVSRAGELLEVSVVDDGKGTSVPGFARSGHGLMGMRERILALGGVLESGVAQEGGFRVSIRLHLSGEYS